MGYNIPVSDFDFAGIPTTVEYNKMTRELLWQQRYKNFETRQRSKEYYAAMDDLEREVIVEKVRNAVAAMYDEVEYWLPTNFLLDEGDEITVSFKILKTSIKSTTEEKRRLTSFRLRAASDEVLRIVKELELEDEAINSETEGR